jgi:hypothetical protein
MHGTFYMIFAEPMTGTILLDVMIMLASSTVG